MATQYSNKPIVTDGLVYALDFGNPKSYVSGSTTAQSLIYNPTPATFSTLLPGDIAPPAAAYSVRKVVSSYTGSAMQVQSASATLDIGFDADGNLDTGSIASFAGSGDAFVKIWYDQSGNGYHVSQSTATKQPKIYSGSLGSVILENGKPTLRFDGVDDAIGIYSEMPTTLFSSGQFTSFTVSVTNNNGTEMRVYGISTLNDYWFSQRMFTATNQISALTNASNGQVLSTVSYTNWGNQLLFYNKSVENNTNDVALNGGNITSSSIGTFIGINDPGWSFGSRRSGPYNFLDGNIQEIIFYNFNQSTNRTFIESNINSYYQIYSPIPNPTPGFDTDRIDLTTDSGIQTGQSIPGFSYNEASNATVIFTGETKADSTLFSQDGITSIISTTSSVGFGSPDNTFGRNYPVSDGLNHIAFRFSSGSVDCFVNGVPVTASLALPTGSAIDTAAFAVSQYSGSLGNLQIYNRPLTSDEIYNNFLIQARRYNLPITQKSSLDENANLFLESAGITDPIITSSIDTFVRGLKSNNLWDKMIAIYPFVGTGSEGINLTGSQLWNLKEPSLVTYPLSFTGSWIGSTSGSAPSGSNTNITLGGMTPSQYYPFFNTQSAHISILSYDTPVSSSYLMGTGMTEELALSTLAGDYGTPAAAYSVRKVRTAYSGALMDVRRSLDNVTASIGYVANGDLDTGSLLDWTIPGRNDLPGAYSGLAAAYSLRKVSASYDGPAVDVRRGSDNYIFPIGFTGSGDLDTQTLLQTLTTGSNIIPNSNNIATFYAKDNVQVTSSAVLGPFGIGSGSFLNETSANSRHVVYEYLASTIGGIYNVSVFVKKQERRYVALANPANSDNNAYVVFDLDTTSSISSGSAGTGYSVVSSNIFYVDDGWFRLSFVSTTGRTDFYPALYLVESPASFNIASSAYVGQPGTGSYVYGFQYSSGSILQPYIETTGTARYNQPLTSSMGYVAQWYDQSGNNRHATQTTASRQPLIVSSGSLITENGKPALQWDGVDDYLETVLTSVLPQPNTIVATHKFDTTTDTKCELIDSYPNAQRTVLHIFDGVYALFAGIPSGGTSFNITQTQSLAFGIYNGSNSSLAVNGINSSSLNPGTNGLDSFLIGHTKGTPNYLDGTIQEITIYNSDQSANRPLIENNINNYYQIYTGSNHGFVERWYDQSGNNRHAVQTTAGFQPIIVESGSVMLTNNKPAVSFNGTSSIQSAAYTSQTHPITSFAVFQNGAQGVWRDVHSFSGNSGFLQIEPSNTIVVTSGTTLSSGVSTVISGSYLTYALFNETNSQVQVNNNSLVLGSSGNENRVYNRVFLGGGASPVGFRLIGKISEVLYYPSNQSSNREAIQYGINNYYNIYPQTSSFTTSSFTIKADPTSISGSINNKLTSGIASSGPLGLITVSRTGSDSLTLARNGVTSSFAVPASGALSTGIYLGAINNNGLALGNSPLGISFASVGTGLTNNETSTYFNLVDTLNYGLGRGINSEYIALLSYATSLGYALPSSTQRVHQNRLITQLKQFGIWDKLDAFYLFATDGDQNIACLNWKNLEANTISLVNGPLFTANQGFIGNGSNSYLDTNFIPATHGVNYKLNDASRSVWVYTSNSTVLTATSDGQSERMNNYSSNRVTINSGTNRNGTASGGGTGLISAYRASSATAYLYNNTTVYDLATASTVLSPLSIRLIINGGLSRISMFSMGASLISENSDYINIIQAYLNSISS